MEMLTELGDESVLSAPGDPMVGPGGLQNMSTVSRKMAARGNESESKVSSLKTERAIQKPIAKAPVSPVVEDFAQVAARTRRSRSPVPEISFSATEKEVENLSTTIGSLDEAVGLLVLAVIVYFCKSVGLPGWQIVAVLSGIGFVVWHFRSRLPPRVYDVINWLQIQCVLKKIRRDHVGHALQWCPPRVQRLILLLLGWRLGSFVFGSDVLALIGRRLIIGLSGTGIGLAYIPVHDPERRPAALARILMIAILGLGILTLLDAALGPEASATLAGIAGLSQPSLDTLDRKLARRLLPRKLHHTDTSKKNDIISTTVYKDPTHSLQSHNYTEQHTTHTANIVCSKALRARNLGILLLATDLDATDPSLLAAVTLPENLNNNKNNNSSSFFSSLLPRDSTTSPMVLYIGFFGAWFVSRRRGHTGSPADASFVYLR